MNNPSKIKGTRFESAVVDLFQARGYRNVERRALAGNTDRGDIAGVTFHGTPVVIEAKAVTKIDLAGWTAEATTEARNAGTPLGVVWAKRVGRASPLDGYVVMTGHMFLTLLEAAGR